MWDTFHRSWIYALIAILIVGCVSCSGNRGNITNLIDEMAEHCGENGMKKGNVKPDNDGNDEVPAEVEVECYPPPQRVIYST